MHSAQRGFCNGLLESRTMTTHELRPTSASQTEPMGLRVNERACPSVFEGATCLRFEFSSRGDRVPGRLLVPTTDKAGPHPLILLQPGAGADKDVAVLDLAAPWVRAGAAVASIDLPLHGERSSAKFSERLLQILRSLYGGAEDDELDSRNRALLLEFSRQAVWDLGRCLDALSSLPEIDAERTAYAGFSLGGALGALFCGLDQRPRVVALALSGGGTGPPEIDPCNHVGQIAPRPLLLIDSEQDEVIPEALRRALFDAANEPKTRHSFEATHDTLPGIALKTMWQFLAQGIGLHGATQGQ